MKYLIPCLLALSLAACGVGPDDTTAPSVTQTTPTANAKRISLNQPFVVQFSEAVREEDLTPENVKLTVRKEDGQFGLGRNFMPPSAVSAKFSYNAQTHTLTITPQTALGLNEHYELAVSNVRDLAGNPLPQVYRTQFFTAMHRTVLWSEEKSCIFDGDFLSTAEKCQLPEPTISDANNNIYSQANDLSYGLILEDTQPNGSGNNTQPIYITEYNADGLPSKTIEYRDGKRQDTITHTYTRNATGLITHITRTHQRTPASEAVPSHSREEEDTTEITYQNGKITQAKTINKEKIVYDSPYDPQVWEYISSRTQIPNKSERSYYSGITSYATGKPILAQQTIDTYTQETQSIGDTFTSTGSGHYSSQDMDPNDNYHYGNSVSDDSYTMTNTRTQLPSPRPNFSLSKQNSWDEYSHSWNNQTPQTYQYGYFGFNITETDPLTGYNIGGYSSWQGFTNRAALDNYTPKAGDSIKITKTKIVYPY